jgi:hypothetical protein
VTSLLRSTDAAACPAVLSFCDRKSSVLDVECDVQKDEKSLFLF